jgi:hypothetical protein
MCLYILEEIFHLRSRQWEIYFRFFKDRIKLVNRDVLAATVLSAWLGTREARKRWLVTECVAHALRSSMCKNGAQFNVTSTGNETGKWDARWSRVFRWKVWENKEFVAQTKNEVGLVVRPHILKLQTKIYTNLCVVRISTTIY